MLGAELDADLAERLSVRGAAAVFGLDPPLPVLAVVVVMVDVAVLGRVLCRVRVVRRDSRDALPRFQ